MNDLSFLSATELGPFIKSKQLSPVELTKHLLNLIDKTNPILRTYITPLPELAIQQAREAEKEIMNGQYKGPLHGIPIGIKDNYCTKGIRTTAGSKLFADFIPKVSATVVQKLQRAGTIMLGKQNMNEFGAGLTGINPFFGTTRNPWNIDYMTGGSSSGAATSLAANLTILATGTDTFGSIRVPASMCGVYGLKPTYGLVSTYGVIPSAWSLDTAGPLARSISDLALMLYNMAGFDPNDPASLNVQVPNYRENLNKGIRGLNIGIPTYYFEGLDRDVEKLFQHAITTLKHLGANIKEIVNPQLTMSTFAGYATVSGEASTFHYEWLKRYSEDYSMDTRAFLLAGALTSTPQYVRSQQARRRIEEALNKAFLDIDIMLGPTIPMTTPVFSEYWIEQNLDVVKRCMPFTSPINLTGRPSLSVPMGLDERGLPVGMQFIGNHLSEKLLLQVGSTWESIEPLKVTLER